MQLSSVKAEAGRERLFDSIKMSHKVCLIEFAAIIIFLLQFGTCYLPDYSLTYLDIDAAEFGYLYDDETQTAVLRQNSSMIRQKSLRAKSRTSSKGSAGAEESKTEAPLKLAGEGRAYLKEVEYKMFDSDGDDVYYDEMHEYKREEDDAAVGGDYDEEEDPEESKRVLIERNIEAKYVVEKPDKEMMQQVYEQLLEKLVSFLDAINEDQLSFMYKIEQTRVYNLLMAVVVNDKQKTQKVCQMLGQGFNRLIVSTQDEYFGEMGIPTEWSESAYASTLTASTFDEQMHMFEQADVSYKWQWFMDLSSEDDYVRINDQLATGLYLAKINITAA